MSDKRNGVLEIKAGEQTYKLQYTINALCELEDSLGISMADIEKVLGDKPSLTNTRLLFWIGLREHHPEVDQKAAGAIMDQIGFAKAAGLATTALTHSFGQAGAGDPLAAAPPAKAA